MLATSKGRALDAASPAGKPVGKAALARSIPAAVVPLKTRGPWIAVDARAVAEILGQRSVRSLAAAPPAVVGVIAWQGRAVSLVDIGLLLPAGEPWIERGAPPRRLAVVQWGPSLLALPADVAREVQAVEEDRLEPPDHGAFPFSLATTERWGLRMHVVDIDALVRATRGRADGGPAIPSSTAE